MQLQNAAHFGHFLAPLEMPALETKEDFKHRTTYQTHGIICLLNVPSGKYVRKVHENLLFQKRLRKGGKKHGREI